MRAHAMFTLLILTLLGGFSAGGCQIVAGLTVLQVNAGQGGAGGGSDGCTEECPMSYGCNAVTHQCNTTCSSNEDCAPGVFCEIAHHKCQACGISPPTDGMQCNEHPEKCEAVRTCTPGTCEGPTLQLNTDPLPTKIVCGDECNDITILCQGPRRCSVVCNGNGCKGLTLKCNADGPCDLTCQGAACGGLGVKMMCGANECFADCTDAPGAVIDWARGDSCTAATAACH